VSSPGGNLTRLQEWWHLYISSDQYLIYRWGNQSKVIHSGIQWLAKQKGIGIKVFLTPSISSLYAFDLAGPKGSPLILCVASSTQQ
jgi:hypothetical protein